MSKLDDTLRLLVDDLIASLDRDTGKWRPSWSQASTLPRNATTAIPYRGMNVLLLWGAQIRSAYPTNVWATYRQWALAGGQVARGQHGTSCIKWVEPKPGDDDVDGTHRRLVPTVFTVFNVAQQQGGTLAEDLMTLPGIEREINEIFATFCDPIPYNSVSGPPMYSPAHDVVSIPDHSMFADERAYAATLSHELAHWTGHPSRLNRDGMLTSKFGDSKYAAEELVAEISAALTCTWLGLPAPAQRDDHAAYIKHWLSFLDDDPKLLMTASQAAQRATDLLLSYSEPKEPIE